MDSRTMSLSGGIGLLAPAMAVLMAAGAASAQSAPAARPGFDRPMSARATRVDQPRKEKKSSKNEKSETHINITRSDDDGVFAVTVNGDDVSATINGEEVPADRIQRDDHSIRLLDKDGNTAAEFQIGGAPGTWTTVQGGTASAGSGGQWAVAVPGGGMAGGLGGGVGGVNAPPVMLGITMAQPSDSLLDHLGLEEGTVVLIDKVYDGLPADEAGMEDGDILVELDGQKPLTEDRVREILRAKKPGDDVEVKVMRKGSTKDLKIELQAYDSEKLGGGAGGQVQMFSPEEEQAFKWYGGGDARQALEQALKNIEKMHGQDADAIREEAQKAIEEALKSLDENGGMFKLGISPRAFSGPGGGSVIVGPQPGQVFTTPGQPSAPSSPRSARNGDLSRQMDELRAQLDEVQRSRDELKDQLDEIKAMLKDMRDHR